MHTDDDAAVKHWVAQTLELSRHGAEVVKQPTMLRAGINDFQYNIIRTGEVEVLPIVVETGHERKDSDRKRWKSYWDLETTYVLLTCEQSGQRTVHVAQEAGGQHGSYSIEMCLMRGT